MPIYEYRCESCGEQLEKIQKFSDAPLTDCPDCGAASLVKLVSASSFRLKGSGWYETDFKTGKKKNGVSDDKIKSEGSPDSNTKKNSDTDNKASSPDTKVNKSSKDNKASSAKPKTTAK